MIIYENHCSDCATPSYPCLGSSCPHRQVPVECCDCCEEPFYENAVYEVDGEILCENCLKEKFRR